MAGADKSAESLSKQTFAPPNAKLLGKSLTCATSAIAKQIQRKLWIVVHGGYIDIGAESVKHRRLISYWLLQHKSQLVYVKRLERNMSDYLCPSSNSVENARWLADVRVCVGCFTVEDSM